MFHYSDKGECADKDVLSFAIASEIAAGRGTEHGGVAFDASGVGRERLEEAYSAYVKRYRAVGMDIAEQAMEIAPAAHTSLGGVYARPDCSTRTEGLFVCGETLGGLHGANRIGGCAGAETVTFGAAVGESAAGVNELSEAELSRAEELAGALVEEYRAPKDSRPEKVEELLASLRETVGKDLSLIRDERGLREASDTFEKLNEAAETIGAADTKELVNLTSLKNMLLTAKLIAKASLERKESRGVFYRSDYPEKKPAWNKSIVLKMR